MVLNSSYSSAVRRLLTEVMNTCTAAAAADGEVLGVEGDELECEIDDDDDDDVVSVPGVIAGTASDAGTVVVSEERPLLLFCVGGNIVEGDKGLCV